MNIKRKYAIISNNRSNNRNITGLGEIKMNKRIIAVLAAMVIALFALPAAADGDISVTVTLANAGKLEVISEQIAVNDTDNDGKLTVNDALYCLHEAKYPGGAAAGYGAGNSAWGLSLTKLWGDVSGSYGYYVNDKMSMGLSDEIHSGDRINAFVYTDAAGYSDIYCYFDKQSVSVKKDETVDLILKKVAFDDNYNPIYVPFEGVEITVNGVAAGVKTDAEGKVTLKADKAGEFIVSAVGNDNMILVPPALKMTVTETVVTPPSVPENTETAKPQPAKSPKTGENAASAAILMLASAAVAVAAGKKLGKNK